MTRSITVVLVLLLAACGKAPPDALSVPSPLIGADSDRLWILARASKVGDGRECKDLYLNPDDPRYQGLANKCDTWSRHYADYLAINGFATVEHGHLQDPAYWRWYFRMRQAIADCWQAIGNLSVTANGEERAAHARQRHACDAYDNAIKNEARRPDDLGIRQN